MPSPGLSEKTPEGGASLNYSIRMQDPSNPDPTYLFEALLQELVNPQTIRWTGIFAFASKSGVRTILYDPATVSFLARGTAHLIVGVDAVTDTAAVQCLREYQTSCPGAITIEAFLGTQHGIFHPKLASFTRTDKTKVALVGSGNLTSGGLRTNVEAYSRAEYSALDPSADDSALDRFLTQNSTLLLSINDDRVLQAVANNRPLAPTHYTRPVPPPTPLIPQLVLTGTDDVLVAEIPSAGARQQQVHFNADILPFFDVRTRSTQRVFLSYVSQNGQLGEDEVRPLIYSPANRNYKIEFYGPGNWAGLSTVHPILVVHRLATRTFQYSIVFPQDSTFTALSTWLYSLPSIGHGVHRSLTDLSRLRQHWLQCPL